MGLNILAWVKAKKYTDNAVSQSAGLHREIVNSLPITGDDKVIYMVPITGSGDDNYNEYMWINGAYELIGNTRVDLTDYYNKTQVDTALNGKANTATSLSGYGITDAYTKTQVDTALNGKADTSAIPTALSQLSADATHRLVTDTEKSTWNDKGDKPVFTVSPKKGGVYSFRGMSYNKLFDSLPAGKYLITGVYYGNNIPSCYLTPREADFSSDNFGELSPCGGVLYVELSATSNVYLYIKKSDSNYYDYYGCRFTAVKLA